MNIKLNAAGLLLCAALAAVSPMVAQAATDLADMPMAVRNTAPPNFVFMLDNSGSMNNIVPDTPYKAEAPSYFAKDCSQGTPVPANSEVMLRVVGGVPKIQLSARVGSGAKRRDCSEGCGLGIDTGEVCFDDNATYTNVRLLAETSCGANCLTTGTSYLPATYTGHYLNWYFGTKPLDGWGTRKPGAQTRMEIAKEGAKAAIDTIPLPTGARPKARVGGVTYNGADGGRLFHALADFNTTQRTNIKTGIDALVPSGSTPLSETLADIGHYLTLGYTGDLTIHPDDTSKKATVRVADLFRQDNTSPHRLNGAPDSCRGADCPIQYWCQRSYAILMTDGRPQEDLGLNTNTYLCDYDGDVGRCSTTGVNAYDRKNNTSHAGHLGGPHSYESKGSDYLDDVAQALKEIDLRPDLTPPKDSTKISGMRTYTVGFADLQAKNDPLLQETATQGGGSFLTADNMKSLRDAFVTAINSALEGDAAASAVTVTSFTVKDDTVSFASSYRAGDWTGDLEAFPVSTSTGLPIPPSKWSAKAKLDLRANPQTSRNIASYDGTAGRAFTAANFSNDAIGLTPAVIDYLRGKRSGEGTDFRARKNLLGDIINAEPVIVKYDSSTVVFQGANDGMLHAFDGTLGAAGGTELWAYVPGLVLPNLSLLAKPDYVHRYYVDATPAVGEVGGRKILVGGLGKGGRGFYALDVSSAAADSDAAVASKVLWETSASVAEMGYSFGTPLFVKTPNDGTVVLVTSGYNNNGDGHLWALDPFSGSVIAHVTTGAGSAATPSGLTHLGRLAHLAPGQTERFVYGGDLLGNVWRFDLSTWRATLIAVLKDGNGARQPITTAPVVKEFPGQPGKFFVYVGTGQYLGDSDVPGSDSPNAHATQTQSMYGIIDDTSEASPALPNIRGGNGGSCPADGGSGDFLCQSAISSEGGTFTMTNLALREDDRGWYLDLPVANARINGHPAITDTGVLVFTANVPTTAICDPGGSSWFFAVNSENGGAVLKKIGETDTFESGWSMGNKLSSRPVIVQTSSGKRALIRMSDKTIKNPLIPETAPASPSGWRRVYWRELM